MENYYEKYLRYKQKYLELKQNGSIKQIGGGKAIKQNKFDKFDTILNFIKTSNKEKIQKELYNLIQYKDYCPNILGEGYFGRAYIPEVNKTFPFRLGNKDIELPIVIKETNSINNPDAYAGIDIINKKLYISGHNNITTEALILMYVKKLWFHTVHLPLLLAYGTCTKSIMVTRIITLRHGLPEPIEIDMINKIYNDQLLWDESRKEPTEIIKNNIATLKELFTYIHYKKNKDGTVKLPNGEICNIPELYDYMCISYLATHELLTENNIIPSDMHGDNIFIHWLNDNSHYGDKNIKNLKEIVYKVGKKYYKIKTFGFVIILGDVGTFVIQVKKDVIIVGQARNIKENYKLIDMRLRPNFTNTNFLDWNKGLLTSCEFKKTIAYKIFDAEPYCSYPKDGWHLLGYDKSYLDKLKSTVELLSFFDEKYGLDKFNQNKDNILIEVKKYNIF